MTNENDSIFGNVIYSYTTQNAIDDGVLIEVDPEHWPKLCLNVTLFHDLERVAANRGVETMQVVVPFVNDVLMNVQASRKRKPREDRWYPVPGMTGNATGRDVWAAINDLGGLTIHYPEDY